MRARGPLVLPPAILAGPGQLRAGGGHIYTPSPSVPAPYIISLFLCSSLDAPFLALLFSPPSLCDDRLFFIAAVPSPHRITRSPFSLALPARLPRRPSGCTFHAAPPPKPHLEKQHTTKLYPLLSLLFVLGRPTERAPTTAATTDCAVRGGFGCARLRTARVRALTSSSRHTTHLLLDPRRVKLCKMPVRLGRVRAEEWRVTAHQRACARCAALDTKRSAPRGEQRDP